MGATLAYWEDVRRKGATPAAIRAMGWKGEPVPNNRTGWLRPTDAEYRRTFLISDDETAWGAWERMER